MINSVKKFSTNLNPLHLKYNMSYIDKTFKNNYVKLESIISKILKYDSENIDFLGEEERAFPGNKNFIESGYYKTMLKRYIFAGNQFCKGKAVLDTCSGLGWGTYIISQFAKRITAFDIEEKAIDFCRNTWHTSNIFWTIGNALDQSFLNEKFEVALGMETIEHFSKNNSETYISQIASVLNKKGVFIGTSAFPKKRKTADELCAGNPYHLYIFTSDEIKEILSKYFSKYILIDNWMFIAWK